MKKKERERKVDIKKETQREKKLLKIDKKCKDDDEQKKKEFTRHRQGRENK